MKDRTYKVAEGNYPFRFWIAKAVASEESGKMVVEGVASTPNVDHDHERMAPDALKAMARIINTNGVPLRVEHSQKDNAVIGTVNKAWIDDRNQLWIKATLDENHPASGILYKGLKDGVRMGLSVGGYVRRAVQEMVEGLGKSVNTFYDVLLDEVSVTQRPSNYDARLMAKSFAKSEQEVDALANVFESNEFLFMSAQGDYLQSFAKSIPAGEWKMSKDYKLIDKNMEDTETKTTKAAETETETKAEKASATDTEEKTTKASETEEKTEKSVTRSEFNELVKMVSEGFNGLTAAFGKMAKAMDTEEEKTEKASETDTKEKKEKSAEGSDTEGTHEKAAKDDTYDLETVERAVKRIKSVAQKASETDEKAEKAACDETETRTTKSIAMHPMDEFVFTVADAIERMEKSMKDHGFQTEHIAKAVINNIRSNPEFQKDIASFMAEPGQKKSVINGTPFVKTKDGRVFKLTLAQEAQRTEKSADAPKDFKGMWGSKFSSSPASE